MFKKTCFVCGAKVDKIYDSKCENCFREEHPPIVEVKPINLKYCNSCNKVFYENHLIDQDKAFETLNKVILKYVVVDKHYTVNSIEIVNFDIKNSRVKFDIDLDCDLKEL